jgi:hypothetical protein
MRLRTTAVALSLALAIGGVDVSVGEASAARCYPASEWFPDAVTTLHGDVDGDGTRDLVHTRARWHDGQTCRAQLVIRTSKALLTRRVQPLTGMLVAPPSLAGLVRLEPGRRLDVALVVWVGASTGFLDVYRVRGGEIGRVSRDAFAYAGSIVNRAGVDCVRGHGARLVASTATLDLRLRYHVERRFYALRAGALVPIDRLRQRELVGVGGLRRFPELYSTAPFPSCTVVPGAA